jgi:hypothetical protein
MTEELSELGKLPPVFWLAGAVWVYLVGEAIVRWHESWAKPALVTYGTIAAWYLGDLLYIGMEHFDAVFPTRIVSLALWQVVLFLVAYRWLVWWLVPKFFRGIPPQAGPIQIDQSAVPHFFLACFLLWLGLFLIAAAMTGWKIMALLWPPSSSEQIGMFAHPGVGSGADFLVATAGYLYLLVCSSFGVLFILNKGLLRFCALAMVLISWPNIWFGPFRNTMLALFLPGVLTYWLFDRSWWQVKALVTLLLFLFVNFWFIGVEEYRGGTELSLASRMNFVKASSTETRHEGLDMLEELCWMDAFIEAGVYRPNMGERYFDELANIVPRTFWPDKPMIGMDYASARGFGGNSDSAAGVYASIATGMIGQGVANFGRFFGVVAAAFLMTCWTGLLARLWLQRDRLPRLFLFIVGCGLTFNMGRDITLLVLWPFWFGMIGVWIWEKFFPPRPAPAPAVRERRPPRPSLGPGAKWRTASKRG